MLQANTRLLKDSISESSQTVKNVLETDLARKIGILYSSIIEARAVLTEYKSELSTLSGLKADCITPLQESTRLSNLFYKREDLTVIKAYKIRGAFYQMKKIVELNPNHELKFIAASTGNHALGVLKSAKILKVSSVVICVSKSITDFKREKLENRITTLRQCGVNAKLVVYGENFDETNEFAKKLALCDDFSFYIDPYNNKNAVAGQGTIGLELLEQLNEKFKKNKKIKELVLVAPIGGGGLISGTACALKTGIKNYSALKDIKLRIVGVCLENLNSLYGDAIKVKHFGSENIDYLSYFLDKKLFVSDLEMKMAMDFVFKDVGALVEGASAATLKAIFDKTATPNKTTAVVCLLSGGNVLGI